ncbi:hypothetical protein D3C87_1831700 [compost metagenome]
MRSCVCQRPGNLQSQPAPATGDKRYTALERKSVEYGHGFLIALKALSIDIKIVDSVN